MDDHLVVCSFCELQRISIQDHKEYQASSKKYSTNHNSVQAIQMLNWIFIGRKDFVEHF